MEATTALMWLTMTAVATTNRDNVTEASSDYNVSKSPGKLPSSLSLPYISPSVRMAFYVVTVIVSVVGVLANAYVLVEMDLASWIE